MCFGQHAAIYDGTLKLFAVFVFLAHPMFCVESKIIQMTKLSYPRNSPSVESSATRMHAASNRTGDEKLFFLRQCLAVHAKSIPMAQLLCELSDSCSPRRSPTLSAMDRVHDST